MVGSARLHELQHSLSEVVRNSGEFPEKRHPQVVRTPFPVVRNR
jgi:hypothetical protein